MKYMSEKKVHEILHRFSSIDYWNMIFDEFEKEFEKIEDLHKEEKE